MERMVDLELTDPRAILVPTPLQAPPFCHLQTSAPALLLLVTVVPKDNLDHPVKAGLLDLLAPTVSNRPLDRLGHLDPQVQMANPDPKVHLVTPANKCPASPDLKAPQDHQDQLVNPVQAANLATTESQGPKVLLALREIVVQPAIPETPVAQENRVTLATKVYLALVLNARQLVWLLAINRLGPISIMSSNNDCIIALKQSIIFAQETDIDSGVQFNYHHIWGSHFRT